MKYLLDSSFLIDILRKNKNAIDFLKAHTSDTLTTSSVCIFEAACGVERSDNTILEKKRKGLDELVSTLSHIYTLVPRDAVIAGKIYADLAFRGEVIDDVDILIAATAIRAEAIILTRNIQHFQRVKHLEVVDPYKI